MRRDRSIDPQWFEDLYRADADPWRFETSDYERAKYDHTLARLPRDRFASALEVGCANAVLTGRLAPRCAALLAVDVSETALAAAAHRCAALPQVVFERRRLPGEMPPGRFDLVLLSEVVYYWDRGDVAAMAGHLARAVPEGGHVLLVHYLGETDYPLSGDAAVDGLLSDLGDAVRVVAADRRERYRLDLWERG